MDRVADFESVGWGFESLVPRQTQENPLVGFFGFLIMHKDSNLKGPERNINIMDVYIAKCSSRNEYAGDERQMHSICLSPSCLAKNQKTHSLGFLGF